MKLSKSKNVILALLAAVILAALCFGLIAVNGGTAYAEETGVSDYRLSGYEGKDFVYSAEFTPANGDAQTAGLVFGAADQTYWAAVVDLNGGVKLQTEKENLKTADYEFEANKKFKITVVMNDEVAKIFIDNGGVAVICCKLENYKGGKLGIKAGDDFTVSNIEFTDTDLPDADIYCNGYEVLKVVNLTDGNKKLNSGEYTISGGNLTVSEAYLKTLESDTEYTFRVVTSFTDFDFKITTEFTAVTVTPAVEKYYRNDDVTLELSGSVKVNKLYIDGKECKFTQTEDQVVISAEETISLTSGSHSVKLYTEKGRPETTITVSEKVETVTEPEVKASHVFLWIDLAIFLSAIVGYTVFSVISKRKKK